MSTEILELIKNRDRVLCKFRKTKNQEDYEKFPLYRNQVKFIYYVNVVNENKNKPKKLWQILKDLGTSAKCKTKASNIGLKISNTLTFDKGTVANHFNTFFFYNYCF